MFPGTYRCLQGCVRVCVRDSGGVLRGVICDCARVVFCVGDETLRQKA